MLDLNEQINTLEAKQIELTELNAKMAKYNHNCDNFGCNARLELIAQMQQLLNEIADITTKIKNF